MPILPSGSLESIIRKVFPDVLTIRNTPIAIKAKKLGFALKSEKLSARHIVSIQPMTVPSSTFFYLDYCYGAKKEENENNTNRSDEQK